MVGVSMKTNISRYLTGNFRLLFPVLVSIKEILSQVLVKTLGKLQNEMKRIKPESPSKLSTVGDLCAFAELLSLVRIF